MKSSLVLAVFAGAAAVSAQIDTNCWQTHKGKYIQCYAKNAKKREGTLNEMLEQCKNLREYCIGVTCSKNPDTGVELCSCRHHRSDSPDCPADSRFLGDNVDETTYVKTCAYNQNTFVQTTGSDFVCNDNKVGVVEVGSRFERQLACAAMGEGLCFGVVCTGDTPEKKEMHCSIRLQGQCSEVANNQAISYRMISKVITKAPANAPPGEFCSWETNDGFNFACTLPQDKAPTTLALAQAECIRMRQSSTHVSTFCNGVVCGSGVIMNPDEKSCVPHLHCVKPGSKMLVESADKVSFVTRCHESQSCSNPCYVQKEWADDSCRSDCDCDNNRICNGNNYCAFRNGLKPEQAACREGDASSCKFEWNQFRYISCHADASNIAELSLADAKDRCIALGAGCIGLTCNNKKGTCTLRNHLAADCAAAAFLAPSETEDSYVKCCGATARLHCPRAFEQSGHSKTHGFLMALLVIGLIGAVGFLAYKNRVMAQQFIAPDKFSELPQDSEENPDNWIINNSDEEAERD